MSIKINEPQAHTDRLYKSASALGRPGGLEPFWKSCQSVLLVCGEGWASNLVARLPLWLLQGAESEGVKLPTTSFKQEDRDSAKPEKRDTNEVMRSWGERMSKEEACDP
eukprot:640038-Amphidinium_carterae.1